jgi:hypothetical protein
MSHEETFFADRKRLIAGLAADFSDRLADIIKKRRKASLALAGGTTPSPLYEELSHRPLNWEKVSVTLTDERWVSPEDPASNEWLVREYLLKRRAAAATFIPFKTNHAKATGGAVVTEKRIAPIMPFDIVLLGMGPDGHIASLIPGADGFDVAAAAEQGNANAKLALDLLVGEARRWIGGYFFQLNGADAIVFTAGIGENRSSIRAGVCADLDQLGIELDEETNSSTQGREAIISKPGSRVKVMVIAPEA